MFVLYKILSNIKDSRTWTIIKGLLVLFVVYILSSVFDFYVIKSIFQSCFYIASFSIIIIFSSDIKKLLEKVGKKNIWNKPFKLKELLKEKKKNYTQKEKETLEIIQEITKASKIMSKAKTGALILFERNSSLSEYNTTGIPIDAKITSQLILNIFEHNTPLHDGAMIIKDNRILSATCYLPLSDNNDINKKLGTRHRAAIGVSEVTDCLVLVVSEETGGISICQNGKIKKVNSEDLENELKCYLLNTEENKKEKKIKKGNLKSILLSFVFGLILWISVFNYQDPIITKDFTLPVTIINESAISSVNQSYEILEGDTVTFQVSGKNSIVKDLNEENFKAVADLSKLSYVYAVPITIVSDIDENLDITIVKNDTMKVKLDEIIEANIDVVAKSKGSISKNYKVKSLIPETTSITVKGPKSKVSKMKEAVATVDITGISKDTIVSSSFKIYDKNGDKVSISDCVLSRTETNVEVLLYKTKTIPLKISTTGNPNNYYKLKSLKTNVTEIAIAGEDNLLKTISSIDAVVDITGLSKNTKKILNLKEFLPEGIELVDEDLSVTVELELEGFKTKTFEINLKDIALKNLHENLSCTVSNEKWNVKVSAIEETLDNLNITDFQPYLDLTNLTEGEYNLNLQFTEIADVVISEIPNIQITISKK